MPFLTEFCSYKTAERALHSTLGMKGNLTTDKEYGVMGLGYCTFAIKKCSERQIFTAIINGY